MDRGSSQSDATGWSPRRIAVLLTVVAIFGLALFIRGYWNVGEAKAAGQFVLSGNDPYYHKHVIDYIQAHWRSLVHDPMLNYPYGSFNPNPPLYEWSVALEGVLLAPLLGGLNSATWWALEWNPAVWGALTIVPVFLIGRELFDTPAGLLGAFFLATATSHISRTALGFSDHDAMIMFFVTLGFYFYLRAIRPLTGQDKWVGDWRSTSDIATGFARLAHERRLSLAYGFLAGISIAAVGLIWKGFPYAIGIIFLYAILAFLVDHWRNRDPLALFAVTLVTLGVATFVPLPYYLISHGVFGYIRPVFFIDLSLLVAGLIFVTTRDLPSILVFPAFVVGGILGLLIMFFVVPEVAHTLLYSLVYFRGTALYKTIAEAQPADFNTAVFSVGPLVYLLALAALPYLAWRAWRVRGHVGRTFMLVWGLLAVYMAHSAVRFMFNATVPMAILGAWMTARFVEFLDLDSLPDKIRRARGGWRDVLRTTFGGWQVWGAIAVAVLVVVPNVFLAVDAGIPPAYEQQMQKQWLQDQLATMGVPQNQTQGQSLSSLYNLYTQKALAKQHLPDTTTNRQKVDQGFAFFVAKRLGAFGQGFLPTYWQQGLDFLDHYDQNTTPNQDRPAFLSWWDYGHWSIYVAQHPTVADNFQNGYRMAGHFITAQNETQAIQLMAGRYIKLFTPDQYKSLMVQSGVNQSQVNKAYGQMSKESFAPAVSEKQAVTLQRNIENATCNLSTTNHQCKKIRYFAVDVRLLPYDDPSTPQIEQSSIFYAPVVLAGENPQNFTDVLYTGSLTNPIPTSPRHGTDKYNVSEIRFMQANPTTASQFQVTGQVLEYKIPFFNSMFYRAYVGAIPRQLLQPGTTEVDGSALNQPLAFPSPALGLKHFRLIYMNDALRILSYYQGAHLKGTVYDSHGHPESGNVTVAVYDDAGRIIYPNVPTQYQSFVSPTDLNVFHSTATAKNGSYDAVSPFNMTGGNITLKVRLDGVQVATTHVTVTRAQAEQGATITGGALNVHLHPGTVKGVAYWDKDGNGKFNASVDKALQNVTLVMGNQTTTTNATGHYVFHGVDPGARTIKTTNGTYQVDARSANVGVPSNKTTTHNVGMNLRKATVHGTAWHDTNGNGTLDAGEQVPKGTQISFKPDGSVKGNTAKAGSTVTDANGTYALKLTPGTYTVAGNFTDASGQNWVLAGNLTVPKGTQDLPVNLRFKKASS